jgi:hypothetical protein
MKKMIFVATFSAGILMAGLSNAQSRFDGDRQFNERARIHQGIQKGQLTRQESKHLNRQQMRIAMLKRRAMADGIITRRERREIRHAEQFASVSIYNERHDRDYRW